MFTNYSIQILAYTKTGDGPLSESVFCKTLDDVPGPITNVKVLSSSEESIIISWQSPEHQNGVLKAYNIYWKNVKHVKDAYSHSVSVDHTHFEVTSLSFGEMYEFWVTASTLVGEGKSSKPLRQTTGSSSAVAARIISFGSKFTVSWRRDINLVCLSVGRPDVVRKWTFNGETVNLPYMPDGSLNIKNVSEKQSGNYKCHIHNELGDDEIVHNLTVLAPPLPPALEIHSTTSNSLEFQWKIAEEKPTKIKGYSFYIRQSEGEWKELNLDANENSYKIDGLDCGTKYDIYMTAHNNIGTGDKSEIISISTNGSVPTPPSKSDLIEESTNAVSLYLNTWKSNGCPIQYYVVEYAPRSSKEWNVVSKSLKPEMRRLMIPGLGDGAWYTLRMTAHNAAGSSVAEYTFATLSQYGATIAPEVTEDDNGMQGLTAQNRDSGFNSVNMSDDPTPYATCHLSNQPPPLPPPNATVFQGMPMTPKKCDLTNMAVMHGMHMQPMLFSSTPPQCFLNGSQEQVTFAPIVMPPPPQPKEKDDEIRPTYTNDIDQKLIN
ncbi:hypothetical protein CHUAL_003489 [Chamberlinius hualienensis]